MRRRMFILNLCFISEHFYWRQLKIWTVKKHRNPQRSGSKCKKRKTPWKSVGNHLFLISGFQDPSVRKETHWERVSVIIYSWFPPYFRPPIGLLRPSPAFGNQRASVYLRTFNPNFAGLSLICMIRITLLREIRLSLLLLLLLLLLFFSSRL